MIGPKKIYIIDSPIAFFDEFLIDKGLANAVYHYSDIGISPEFQSELMGSDIVILPDNSYDSILDGYNKVAKTISGYANAVNSIKVIDPKLVDFKILPNTSLGDWTSKFKPEKISEVEALTKKYHGEHYTQQQLRPILNIVQGSEVEHREPVWLWYPYIPKGAITVMASDPGVGKTNLATWIAGQVTSGRGFKNYFHGEHSEFNSIKNGYVLYLSNEDSYSMTLLPRFRNNGGNDEKFIYLKEGIRSLDDKSEIDKLFSIIDLINPDLVIIDPLSGFQGKADSNKPNGIYNLLLPIKDKIEKTQTAMLVIHHNNKDTRNTSALNRVSGSTGITGIARSILTVAKNPMNKSNDSIALANAKNNLASPGDTLIFDLIGNPMNSSPEVRFNSVAQELNADHLLGAEIKEDYASMVRQELMKRPLVKAIIDLVNNEGKIKGGKKVTGAWEGTSREILNAIARIEKVNFDIIPMTPKQLINELEELKDPLAEMFQIRYNARRSKGNMTLHRFYRIGELEADPEIDPDFIPQP